MEHEATFPSGLKGVLRSLKVKDEQLFADPRFTKRGDIIKTLLERCFIRLVEPGPYTAAADGRLDWNRVLSGDGFYGLVQLRIASYGEEYEFSISCDACRRSTEHVQNLRELPIQLLPDASRTYVENGTPFETALAGHRVAYKLLTLADERGMAMLIQNRKMLPRFASIAQRIISIEGVPENSIGHKIRFLEELDSGEINDFESEIERVDCGVDTNIEVDCKNCYATNKILLPFAAQFFTRKRASSASDRTLTG